jgi:prevent-host-death family protein
MPNIKPVSDLRNYSEVLRDVAVDEPVFLTKNGRGRYAILDIKEYQKTQATIMLLRKLAEAEASVRDESQWLALEDIEKRLKLKA